MELPAAHGKNINSYFVHRVLHRSHIVSEMYSMANVDDWPRRNNPRANTIIVPNPKSYKTSSFITTMLFNMFAQSRSMLMPCCAYWESQLSSSLTEASEESLDFHRYSYGYVGNQKNKLITLARGPIQSNMKARILYTGTVAAENMWWSRGLGWPMQPNQMMYILCVGNTHVNSISELWVTRMVCSQ